MNNQTIFFNLLQDKIQTQGEGILVSIKLLNENELRILTDDISDILHDFYQIVRQSCEQEFMVDIIENFTKTRLYFVIPKDNKLLEKIATLIHQKTQSYINKQAPEMYFKPSIASIKFLYSDELKADKLVAMLMYNLLYAENNGSYYYYYDYEAINTETLRLRNINMNRLRQCLLEKKIKFMYQPIVDSATKQIIYYECLLRVPDESGKLVSVGSMIEDAENKGLISMVDLTVLEMAIEELSKNTNLSLSLNISNIGMLNDDLHHKAMELFDKYPGVSKRLIIEITETFMNNDFAKTRKFIDSLHKIGCRFALDDFGSGFTSFKQLLSLPIDILKIDGSYIKNITDNKSSRFFVESLIILATNLKIKTVAEFVENNEIAKCLTDMKVDAMQGNFLFSASENFVNLDKK